jgi:hypothetical protein
MYALIPTARTFLGYSQDSSLFDVSQVHQRQRPVDDPAIRRLVKETPGAGILLRPLLHNFLTRSVSLVSSAQMTRMKKGGFAALFTTFVVLDVGYFRALDFTPKMLAF